LVKLTVGNLVCVQKDRRKSGEENMSIELPSLFEQIFYFAPQLYSHKDAAVFDIPDLNNEYSCGKDV
jgi:hypothetical protein